MQRRINIDNFVASNFVASNKIIAYVQIPLDLNLAIISCFAGHFYF